MEQFGKILKFSVKKEAKAFKSFLQASPIAIQKAGTQAVNAGLSTFKTQSSKRITLVMNITARQLKTKLFREYPAKSRELTSSFVVDTRPINLIHFIVAPKNKLPVPQKGVPVRKRKKIKIRILKGQTSTLPKSFIARGIRGRKEDALPSFNYQVFRRASPKSLPLVKRPGVSLFKFFSDQGFMAPIIKTTDSRIRIVFNQKLKFFMLSEFDRRISSSLKSQFIK